MSNKPMILTLLLASTLVRAESLEDKKYWKGQMDYMNESLKSANRVCETTFTFEWVDREKFREETAKTKLKQTPYGVCHGIVDKVDSLCRAGADEKAAVKAKIKGFQCGYANPRKLELNGGILRYMGNNEEHNFDEWAKPWLMQHL